MRAWVVGHNRKVNLAGQIDKMFASLKAPEAAFRLDGLMRDLRFGARRVLRVDCLCQPAVSGDELLMLMFCAAAGGA